MLTVTMACGCIIVICLDLTTRTYLVKKLPWPNQYFRRNPTAAFGIRTDLHVYILSGQELDLLLRADLYMLRLLAKLGTFDHIQSSERWARRRWRKIIGGLASGF